MVPIETPLRTSSLNSKRRPTRSEKIVDFNAFSVSTRSEKWSHFGRPVWTQNGDQLAPRKLQILVRFQFQLAPRNGLNRNVSSNVQFELKTNGMKINDIPLSSISAWQSIVITETKPERYIIPCTPLWDYHLMVGRIKTFDVPEKWSILSPHSISIDTSMFYHVTTGEIWRFNRNLQLELHHKITVSLFFPTCAFITHYSVDPYKMARNSWMPISGCFSILLSDASTRQRKHTTDTSISTHDNSMEHRRQNFTSFR